MKQKSRGMYLDLKHLHNIDPKKPDELQRLIAKNLLKDHARPGWYKGYYGDEMERSGGKIFCCSEPLGNHKTVPSGIEYNLSLAAIRPAYVYFNGQRTFTVEEFEWFAEKNRNVYVTDST